MNLCGRYGSMQSLKPCTVFSGMNMDAVQGGGSVAGGANTMSNLISRGHVMVDYLDRLGRKDSYKAKFEALCEAVDNAPTVDAEPVRHGEWFMHEITDPHGFMHTRYYKCSLCGRREAKKEPFCNCGAMMRRDNESE